MGSANEHRLYVEPIPGDRRRLRKCRCGCDGKAELLREGEWRCAFWGLRVVCEKGCP